MTGEPRLAPNTVFDMAHQSSVATAFVTSYSPEPEEIVDTKPSDQQPPGVDEEIDYNNLEEALTS
jgi:hypothetical protein